MTIELGLYCMIIKQIIAYQHVLQLPHCLNEITLLSKSPTRSHTNWLVWDALFNIITGYCLNEADIQARVVNFSLWWFTSICTYSAW